MHRGQLFDKQGGATAPECSPCRKLDIELEMVSSKRMQLPFLPVSTCNVTPCRDMASRRLELISVYMLSNVYSHVDHVLWN